jgi:methionyl-tRNA formyltransferase
MQNILVMGKGSAAIHAVRIIQEKYFNPTIFAIPDLPPPDWMQNFSTFCKVEGIECIEYENLRNFEPNAFHLGISCFSNHIFTEDEIKKFEVVLNLHNSPLPKYRGVNPINWALKNGERNHGVSIHRIDGGIDTGDIYSQILFGINPKKDEVIDVYKLALSAGKKLIEFAIENLSVLTPYAQNSDTSSYYSKSDFPLLLERSDFSRDQFFDKKRLDL